MNNPVNKEKRRIGFGLGKLEVGSTFAGLVVFLGIWIESSAAINWALKHHVWPREAIGSILVGGGVFAETAIAIFAARQARRAELEAQDRIAEANERAAHAIERAALAELRAAEANERAARIESTKWTEDKFGKPF